MALIWAVPATIAAVLAVVGPWLYATMGVTGRDWTLAALQFPRYLLWVPLTPLIFAAVRRFPIRRPGLARSIVVHAGLALVCVAFVEFVSAELPDRLRVPQCDPAAVRPAYRPGRQHRRAEARCDPVDRGDVFAGVPQSARRQYHPLHPRG